MRSSFGRDSRGTYSRAISGRPRRGSPCGWRRTPSSSDGGGGHTIEDALLYDREYISEDESSQSSTYWELLGVYRCLQAIVHVCVGKLVLYYVDAQNLLGVVSRGSPRLSLNELARELFWFYLEHRIVLMVEWVPRK